MTDLRTILESAGVHVQAFDQMKRPGEDCHPAEPVSEANPSKGKAMNSQENSTAAGGQQLQPSADQQRLALSTLEGPISELAYMSTILAERLENDLTDLHRAGDDNWTIRLTSDQMEILCFAWCEVTCRANSLRKAFYDALDGKGVTL